MRRQHHHLIHPARPFLTQVLLVLAMSPLIGLMGQDSFELPAELQNSGVTLPNPSKNVTNYIKNTKSGGTDNGSTTGSNARDQGYVDNALSGILAGAGGSPVTGKAYAWSTSYKVGADGKKYDEKSSYAYGEIGNKGNSGPTAPTPPAPLAPPPALPSSGSSAGDGSTATPSPTGGSSGSPANSSGSTGDSGEKIEKLEKVAKIEKPIEKKPTPYLIATILDQKTDNYHVLNSLVDNKLPQPLTEDVRIKFDVGYAGPVNPETITVSLMEKKAVYQQEPYHTSFGEENEGVQTTSGKTHFKSFNHTFRQPDPAGNYFLKVEGKDTSGTPVPELMVALPVSHESLSMRSLQHNSSRSDDGARLNSTSEGGGATESKGSTVGGGTSSSGSNGGGASLSSSSAGGNAGAASSYNYEDYESVVAEASPSASSNSSEGSSSTTSSPSSGSISGGANGSLSANGGSGGSSSGSAKGTTTTGASGRGNSGSGQGSVSVSGSTANVSVAVSSSGSRGASLTVGDSSISVGTEVTSVGSSRTSGGSAGRSSGSGSSDSGGSASSEGSSSSGSEGLSSGDEGSDSSGSNTGTESSTNPEANSGGESTLEANGSAAGNESAGSPDAAITPNPKGGATGEKRQSESNLKGDTILVNIHQGENIVEFNSLGGSSYQTNPMPLGAIVSFNTLFGNDFLAGTESITFFSGKTQKTFTPQQAREKNQISITDRNSRLVVSGETNKDKTVVLSVTFGVR